MTDETENISTESRIDKARVKLNVNRYNSMTLEERAGLSEGLADEALSLCNAAGIAERRQAYDVAAARFRMAAQSYQRAHSIMLALGRTTRADLFFSKAEWATQAGDDCELNDLRRICMWQGLIPVVHDGWWRASTGYDPSTGEQIPDMDVPSKLCREARGELEAHRVLARKIENHTLV